MTKNEELFQLLFADRGCDIGVRMQHNGRFQSVAEFLDVVEPIANIHEIKV